MVPSQSNQNVIDWPWILHKPPHGLELRNKLCQKLQIQLKTWCHNNLIVCKILILPGKWSKFDNRVIITHNIHIVFHDDISIRGLPRIEREQTGCKTKHENLMKQYEKEKASNVNPLSMTNPIQVTITTQTAGVKLCMRNNSFSTSWSPDIPW